VKTEEELIREINLGEDSTRQFKREIKSATSLAQEMCAMSNSAGGTIYIGVADDSTITGLDAEQLRTLNQHISAAANEQIRPAIYPQTRVVDVAGKRMLTIEVSDGTTKPYCDKDGVYWIKSGSDKRKASPQELLRLFQQSTQIYLDETITSAGIDTLNKDKFYTFFERFHGMEFSSSGITIEKALSAKNLAKDGKLTLGGLLLFGENVQEVKPFCIIRAVSYPGADISDSVFNDRRDCTGTLEEQYRAAITFLRNNLSRIQRTDTFNTPGELEIKDLVLEEALVNALLHRDYSKNAVIRLLVFNDRVEIISPGSLPNHLTVENIINGNSVMRNPILASYGTRILPYSGLGSGVPRILKNHPDTEFRNDKDGEQFTIILRRSKRGAQ
jgi:ATP-dependent DNA helicase RecG